MASAPVDLAAAFQTLQGSLRGFLGKRVASPEVVEDLLQEVFAKAALAIHSGRGPSNLVGWLYAAARTTVVDHYRAKARQGVELDERLPASEPTDGLHQELSLCLRPLVLGLPDLYRRTLLATDLEGMALQIVADREGVSLSAVKSRASRGRALLKTALLACCHVEHHGGVVADFHSRSGECGTCS